MYNCKRLPVMSPVPSHGCSFMAKIISAHQSMRITLVRVYWSLMRAEDWSCVQLVIFMDWSGSIRDLVD